MRLWDAILAWRLFASSRAGGFFSASLWVAILGMGFGVMALLLALGITEGFSRDYEKAILGSQAHVTVHFEDDIDDPIAVEKAMGDVSRETRISVKNMERIIYREGMLVGGKSLKGLVLKGVSQDYFHKSGIISVDMAAGENEKHLPKIYLGKVVAEESGVKPGVVKLLFPSAFSPKTHLKKDLSQISTQDLKSFFLAGVFETGVYEVDSSFAFLDLAEGSDFFHMGDRVSGFELWLDSPKNADRFSEALRDVLGFPYEILSWKEIHENVFKAMETEKWMFGLLMAVLIVVASLNVLGTLMMLILQKRREIAILRVLGYSWGRLRRVFILDGILIGVLGTASGLAGGLACEFVLKTWAPIRLEAEIYFLKTVPVAFLWDHLIWVSIAALSICLLGCILTLRKITHVALNGLL